MHWRRIRNIGLFLVAFIVLTAVSQIGGLVLCLSWLIARWVSGGRLTASSPARPLTHVLTFLLIYGIAVFAFVPAVAGALGRERLPCLATTDQPTRAVTALTCLLNRNYAAPATANLAVELSRNLARRFPGTVVGYLDASFPFLDGFPVLPRLGHSNGRSIDLALPYRRAGVGSPVLASMSYRYWLQPEPVPDAPDPCWFATLWGRWLPLGSPAPDAGAERDPDRLRAMLDWLDSTTVAGGLRYVVSRDIATLAGVSSAGSRALVLDCPDAGRPDHVHLEID